MWINGGLLGFAYRMDSNEVVLCELQEALGLQEVQQEVQEEQQQEQKEVQEEVQVQQRQRSVSPFARRRVPLTN